MDATDKAQYAPSLRSWRVPATIVSFVDALREANAVDVDDVILFYEKPWKWEAEYVLWLNNDQPMDDSCDGWDDWLRLMSERA